MFNSLKILRPVGNHVSTTKSLAKLTTLLTYPVYFYNSGTAALAAAITAICDLNSNIKSPEIIVPAYGCPDLISAIVYTKATPVLIDLQPNSPRMSLERIKESITADTIAIIAVRFFGIPEDNKKLGEIAKQNNLVVIEDSAQGFPSEKEDAYWNGDLIVLSFGRGKPVNLLGGGAILAKDLKLIKLLPRPSPIQNGLTRKIKYVLRLFLYNLSIKPLTYGLITLIPIFKIGQTIYKPLNGINNIQDITKSLLKSNLKAYKTNERHQKKYQDIFKEYNSSEIIDLPTVLKYNMSQPLLRYPILIGNSAMRDKLYEKLKPYGASLMYKQPLHTIDNVGKDIKQQNGYFPNATLFSHQLLTLPTHESVDDNTFKIIKDTIKSTIKGV